MNWDSLLFKLNAIVIPEYGAFQFLSAGLYALAGILGALHLSVSLPSRMLMAALGALMAGDELLMIHECISEATHSHNLLFAIYGLIAGYLTIHILLRYGRRLGWHLGFAAFIGLLVVGTEALDWTYIPNARILEELGEALAPCLAIIWILTLEPRPHLRRLPHISLVALAVATLTTALTLGTRESLCPKVTFWSQKFWNGP